MLKVSKQNSHMVLGKHYFLHIKVIGKGLEKIGEKTTGAAKAKIDPVIDAVKGLPSAARKAIGTKIDEKILGRKHPEKISDPAQKALTKADEAIAEIHNKRAEIKEKQRAISKGNLDNAVRTQTEKDILDLAKEIKQKKKEAYDSYTNAADEGSTKAMIALGDMHSTNTTLTREQRISKARELYNKAFQAGDQTAQSKIENLNRKGLNSN